MDSSKDGVVYFSMGSAWQSKDIPEHIVNELLKVFGNLKQTVIWKFEKNLNDLPKNVHIVQWAPQTSILGSVFSRHRRRYLYKLMINKICGTITPTSPRIITAQIIQNPPNATLPLIVILIIRYYLKYY